MRGQAGGIDEIPEVFGITPADAGTSAQHDRRGTLAEDHPRGCGDKCVYLSS